MSPKAVCSTLGKAKTKKVQAWSKERFIDPDSANQEDGSPSNSSNPP